MGGTCNTYDKLKQNFCGKLEGNRPLLRPRKNGGIIFEWNRETDKKVSLVSKK
jgi:hypothetical protein